MGEKRVLETLICVFGNAFSAFGIMILATWKQLFEVPFCDIAKKVEFNKKGLSLGNRCL